MSATPWGIGRKSPGRENVFLTSGALGVAELGFSTLKIVSSVPLGKTAIRFFLPHARMGSK